MDDPDEQVVMEDAEVEIEGVAGELGLEAVPFSGDECAEAHYQESREHLADQAGRTCKTCGYDAAIQEGSIIQRMTQIWREQLGQMANEAIYEMLSDWFKEEFKDSQQRGGMRVPTLSVAEVRNHFEFHVQEPLKRIVTNLQFVQNAAKELRYRGVRVRDAAGNTHIDLKQLRAAKEIIDLELKLVREFTKIKGEMGKKRIEKRPASFNSF